MTTTGSMAGYYTFNGVRHSVGLYLEDGQVTHMYNLDVSPAVESVYTMGLMIYQPSGVDGWYAQIKSSSLPAKLKYGNEVDGYGNIVSPVDAYVDFDGPRWVEGDPSSPSGSSSASFTVVESVSMR